jgi:hypothetical protein
MGSFASAFDVVEEPTDFARAEVGVRKQSGSLLNERLMPAIAKIVACGGGAAALPNYRAMYGATVRTIPHNDCFALIGDAYGFYLYGRYAGGLYCLARRIELSVPYLHRIVFDPTGLRIVLRERPLREGDDLGSSVQ